LRVSEKMNKITINYQFSEKQFLDALALHHKLQIKRKIIGMILMIIFIGIYYVINNITRVYALLMVVS